MTKTLVIGGGMSGLTYAILAASNGEQVTVAERNARVGKKIAATGNGKCNVGNANVSVHNFNDSPIVRAVLSTVSVQQYLQFLQSVGIYVAADEMGRLYPLSASASNVVDCLRHRAEKAGAKLLVDSAVTSLCKQGDGFVATVGNCEQSFHKVVLACGSGSQAVAPNLQHVLPDGYLTPLVPSLVPVKVRNADVVLNGVRAAATVTLFANDIPVATQKGEVLFRDYGLSGICIFNLSAVIARNAVLGKNFNYVFSLDLVPTLTQEQLTQILQQRIHGDWDKVFYGILHNKVAQCVLKRCNKNASAQQIACAAKNFTYKMDKLLDWSMSQVTAGGIDSQFVDVATLQLPNGVVALGEVLNVDGDCGGNNLYFAAASALHLFTDEQRQNAYAKKW